MKKTISALLLIAVIGLGGCGRGGDEPNKPASGTIKIKGSDTMVNANQKLAEEFMKENPQMFIAVTGGGSGVGIASLISKSCDVAAASRGMKPKEIEQARSRGVAPNEITVAHDGVAVIVNVHNSVEKLTINDLHRIYTGKAKNWKEFGGKDMPITALSREVNSGTYEYFKEEVIQLGQKDSKDEFFPQTLLLPSSQAIVEEAANNEGVIGYLGMGYTSDRTKSIQVSKDDKEYYLPTVENVMQRKYPLSRPLFFYTDGEPKDGVKQFIDFALSQKGQEQFKITGFVPVGGDDPKKN
jgi:phosphate transport system substrate-binding protein